MEQQQASVTKEAAVKSSNSSAAPPKPVPEFAYTSASSITSAESVRLFDSPAECIHQARGVDA